MPITGTFEADFSQFSAPVAQATRELATFSATSTSTAGSLTSLESSATTTGGAVANLHQSYLKFDGALSAVGIHIGPQIKALEDFANAATMTGAELGLVASAGLAVGAAMAAWQIGSWIAEVTGADKAIEAFTLHLWGMKTASEQAAEKAAAALAHEQELIFEAAAIAGKTVDNLKDAQAALDTFARDQEREAERVEAAYQKHRDAMREVNEALKDRGDLLASITPGERRMIENALEAGVAQGTVAEAFGRSAAQIRAVKSAMDEAAASAKAAADAAAAAQKAAAAEVSKHWTDVGTILDEVLGANQLKKATNWVDAIDALGGSVSRLSNDQLRELAAAMDAGIAALAKSGDLTSAQSSRFAELKAAAEAAIPSLQTVAAATDDYAAEAEAATKANDALIASLAAGAKTQAAAATQHRSFGQEFSIMGGEIRATNAELEKFHAELALLPQFGQPTGQLAPRQLVANNASTFSWATRVLGGAVPSTAPGPAGGGVTVNVNGSVLSTQAELATLVSDAITQAYRQSGNRLPA